MNEDEEYEYKDLWSNMRKLPNNMMKIMLARKNNELKRKKKVKKKKKNGNSPMDSSLSGIHETSVRICNSVSMYRKEEQDKFFLDNDYITCGLVKKWTAS